MSQIEIKVPDIGDFDTVEVIEVLVAEGDTIKEEQSLITVESDKASMEIPSSAAGKIVSLAVKVGDKVSEGTVILTVEAEASADASSKDTTDKKANGKDASSQDAAQPSDTSEATAAASGKEEGRQAQSSDTKAEKAGDQKKSAAPASGSSQSGDAGQGKYSPPASAPADGCDVLVLGAGPGGYSAAFRAADLGLSVVLVERYATLGGVCLNVGCIPSKALLHNVAVLEEAKHLAQNGIAFAEPTIDLDKLRAAKDKVVSTLTGGLTGMAKARKVKVVQGVGTFADEHHLTVKKDDGSTETVAFKHAIIAAGSQSVKLPFLPQDERIVDSTGALQLKSIPKKMLIIGGGIIGLEMGTVYSALGARLDVVEMLDGLMQGADRDLVKVWQKKNEGRFDQIMVKTKTVSAEAKPDGIWVKFEGDAAPAEPQRYDLVLQAVGRSPNGGKIGADRAGVKVSDRGFIDVDEQMRTNVPHIFAIGDIVGQPMLAHKAVHEAHVAAEVIAGQKSYFDVRVIPSVAYTDPEVAWAGLTEEEAKKQGVKYEKGVFPWAASGRAIANGRSEGFTKLLFDAESHRIIGGSIVGTHAGDLISEVALAVEMGADTVDIGKTIHPHPTLGESVGMAAEVAHGTCTDLPPVKRK